MSTHSPATTRQQFEAREQDRIAHAAKRDLAHSQQLRSAAELESIADDAAANFAADATADEILAWVASEFGLRTAVACSMADLVLPHLVAQHIPWVDTLFLDTGYHFSETLGTRDAAEAAMELTIIDVVPQQSVAEQDLSHGEKLFQRDPALCCQLRKVEPLTQVLAKYEVWITGVRRDESPERADTPLVTWDAKNQLVKVNPLATWTFDDIVNYSESHQLIANPLISQGYPSIGCAPCTRRVAAGEDHRAGRWAGFNKTECGLHT